MEHKKNMQDAANHPPASPGAGALIAHRYFFALRPDPVTARATRAFAEARLGARGLLSAERLHVTLALTDDRPADDPALVAALRRAGGQVRAAPFALLLDQLSAGQRSVALRPARKVAPLHRLQAAIAAAMQREAIAMRADWQFHPHETLGYRKGPPFTQAVAGFCWQAEAFVLVHSFVGLTRHEVIGQWPLRPPDETQGRLL